MKGILVWFASACLLGAVGAATAQGASAPARGPGAGPPASAPGMGMGPGMGRGRGGMYGPDYSPGWSMMTPDERSQHQAKMRSMTNYDECKTYMAQQHEQMAARAKAQGAQMPAQPRRDGCAGLKP
ncbi:MAG: hypothetical protein MUF16_12035 [Burkholderiaceae bacterium]|jgi:hypothetical protein|nr:hypothetical protein [Burkholderiaceae bacterium]